MNMATEMSDLIGRDVGDVIMVTMAMEVTSSCNDLIGRDVDVIIMVIG